MTWGEIVLVLLALTGIGLLYIGYRQTNGTLPKDSSFGTKTRATTASQKAWQAGNTAAAPFSYLQGVVCILSGALGFVLYSPNSPVYIVFIGVAVVAIMVIAGFQVAKANGAAKHADGKNTP